MYNHLLFFVGTLLAFTIDVASSTSFDTLAAREEAKPFYLKDIQIGDTTLPFSKSIFRAHGRVGTKLNSLVLHFA